ncbi:GNAT family N-acetyltransferase [Oceanomicrobium pacificus]|uniref:GNAT family N-acetyltransferase n=1 Tax=Oceanomicrobium pacificus TaxID=2692916 RepID=A0A6B0TTX7_9RHOB|nr:GNAT family N-acetyltransferase [Oceanomicrobium pacificus]MXU66239.1 GNAT family N-acetyltransferase [Oceanomicrobium pacificus]
MTVAPELTTERLHLRPLRDSDAAAIALHVGDRRVARNLAVVPFPYPKGAAEEFIARSTASDAAGPVWAIVPTGSPSDELVGVISYDLDGTVAKLGYWLAPAFWNSGYMTEAAGAVIDHARAQGVTRMETSAHQDNPASAKVLSKVGFHYVGDDAHFSVAQNATVDVWLYRLDFDDG